MDWASALTALQEKYEALLRMRDEREVLEAQGILHFAGDARRARREQAKRLSRRFPGLLSELDELDLDGLRARRDDVQRARAAWGHGTPPPLWIRVMTSFHRRWREMLAIKEWARATAPAGPPTVAQLRALHAALTAEPQREIDPAAIDLMRLGRVLDPRTRRVGDLVWQELAQEFGRPVSELRRLLFGAHHGSEVDADEVE